MSPDGGKEAPTEFKILGALEARSGDRPLSLRPGRQRALFALLLLRRNELVSSERLLEDLWSGDAPASGRKSLQVRIANLRRALGPRGEALVTQRLAFLGNDPWSVPSLEAIAGEPELELSIVVTNPPRPAGRGDALRPTAVAASASRLGLPLLEADGVRSGAGHEEALRCELPVRLGRHTPRHAELRGERARRGEPNTGAERRSNPYNEDDRRSIPA